MNADDLRALLRDIGLTQVDFAYLVGVTPRAVSMWLTGQREVPGPVASYLRLFASLPKNFQALELTRLRHGQAVPDGMYSMTYTGVAGTNQAILVLNNGLVFGYDIGRSKYDGTYLPSQTLGCVDLHLLVTVPPGTGLVQGVPAQPMEYAFNVICTVRACADSRIEFLTPVAPTPIQAHIQFLRPVPHSY